MEGTQTSSLGLFWSSLSSTQQDRFVRVLGRLQTQGRAENLERLERRLEMVHQQLDEVTHRQHAMTARKEDLKGLVVDLDKALAEAPDVAELLQLKLLISQLERDVDEEIRQSKPIDLLAEKTTLRDRINQLRLLARLANIVTEQMRRHDGR